MLTSCATCSGSRKRTRHDAPGSRPCSAAAARRAHRLRPDPAARVEASAASRRRTPPAATVLLRVGSRGSRLALTQAERAADALRRPGVEIALVPITTAGDRDRTRPFGEIGSRGVFVKELEEALLEGRIDVAVHSAKDMTSTDVDGLAVGAYPVREDPRDALCGASEIRPGHADRHGLGTSQRRSCSRSSRRCPSNRCAATSTRGCASVASAASTPSVLAACGLDRARARRRDRHSASIPHVMLPEAGQGALALQVRGRRGGPRRGGRRPGDAASRRGRAPLRRGRRRRLPGAGRRAPRRDGADRPRGGRGRKLARAPRGRATRTTLGRELAALAPVSEVATVRDAPRACDRDRRRPRSSAASARAGAPSSAVTQSAQMSAQTRHTFAPSVRVPVGGWGLGTGRRGATIATIETPGRPARRRRCAGRTVPPRASGGRPTPRRGSDAWHESSSPGRPVARASSSTRCGRRGTTRSTSRSSP